MQRNFVAEFHRENVSFTHKTANYRFWATIAGLRGNVCDSSLGRWKARSRLTIGYNWSCLLALMAEALIRLNPPLLKGVGHWSSILG